MLTRRTGRILWACWRGALSSELVRQDQGRHGAFHPLYLTQQVQNPVNIRLIIEQARVPVLVDAGVGTPSDAVLAMELGCDAVLMNTAIAGAKDPILMASAMKHAVIAGRQGYLAGRMPRRMYASASSPMAGLI